MDFLIELWIFAAIAVVVWQLLKRSKPKAPRILVTAEPSPTAPVYSDHLDSDAGEKPDKDNWEGNFWEVSEPLPVNSALRLSYEDGNGRVSERTVDVRQFGGTPYGAMLIGHCRMRNDTRTFRTDRIRQCVDEATGEVVDDVYAYLRAKYEGSPDYSLNKLYNDEYDTLRVLLYVGKADGQLRAPEKSIISTTCRVLSNDWRITDKQVGEMLARMDTPTLHAFKIAVGRINKRGNAAVNAGALKTAGMIVATQKTVQATEQEALDYMAKRFAKAE